MRGVLVVKKIRCFLLLAISGTIALAVANAQDGASSKHDSPVGDWRGISACQVKPSGCHDEDSLYHFKPGAKSEEFEIQADKVVDGKPVTIGKGPCNYDGAGHLVCPVSGSGATVSFDVRGDMQGTMRLEDGTIWRRISLKRVHK